MDVRRIDTLLTFWKEEGRPNDWCLRLAQCRQRVHELLAVGFSIYHDFFF